MKAWRIYGFGDIRLDELVPDALASGTVRVKVLVFQPSITEMWAIGGRPTTEAALVHQKIGNEAPIRLFGHEFCGQVVEIGEGVVGFSVGDRVSARAKLPCHRCPACMAGDSDACRAGPLVGLHMPGCFAEEIVIPAEALVKLVDDVPDTAGACVQPLSSTLACITSAVLPERLTVGVIGLGLMGLLGIQAVRAFSPASVIGISRRDRARRTAAWLGADETYSTDDPNLLERYGKAAGRRMDIIFECSGSPDAQAAGPCDSIELAARLIADRGQIVEVATFSQPVQISTSLLRSKSVRLIFPDVAGPEHLEQAVRLLADGTVKTEPILGEPLHGIEALPQAMAMMQERGPSGALGPVQVRVARANGFV